MLGDVPRRLDDGSVVVSPEQLRFHIVTELLSVGMVMPFAFWLATRPRPLNTAERVGLVVLGAAIFGVDGVLAFRLARAKGWL